MKRTKPETKKQMSKLINRSKNKIIYEANQKLVKKTNLIEKTQKKLREAFMIW